MSETANTLAVDPSKRWTIGARRGLQIIVAVLLLYAGLDLFWPLHRDVRQFDPVAVGRLETQMWRSYYDRKPLALFLQLAETLRTLYQFPLLRSYLGAYHATFAAFRFKDGHQRSDYEEALPALQRYFDTIRNTTSLDFDTQQAAALELEWWIVHREAINYPRDALGQACAEVAAYIYRLPLDSTLEHGRLRAAAMVLRDVRGDAGEVTDADWMQIEALLRQSYQSLHRAVVNATSNSTARS